MISDTLLLANSAALRGRNLGTTIDTFRHIVRFNDFATDPLDDFGQRTTLHIVTDTTLSFLRPDLPGLVYNPFRRPLDLTCHRANALPHTLATWLVAHYHLSPQGTVPSTGFAAIHHLLFTHGPLTLAGFDSFRQPRTHRHDPHGISFHDYDTEAAAIAHHTTTGLLTIL